MLFLCKPRAYCISSQVIPIEGTEKVNGEDQKTFGEILHEIIISKYEMQKITKTIRVWLFLFDTCSVLIKISVFWQGAELPERQEKQPDSWLYWTSWVSTISSESICCCLGSCFKPWPDCKIYCHSTASTAFKVVTLVISSTLGTNLTKREAQRMTDQVSDNMRWISICFTFVFPKHFQHG